MSMPFAFLEQLGQWGQYHTHLVLWGIGGGMLLMVLINLLLRKKASLTFEKLLPRVQPPRIPAAGAR